MKVVQKDGGPERRVVTSMIVSGEVLARVAGKWEKGGLFSSSWSNLVGQWCVDHFERYGKPPGKDIAALFEAWAEGNEDSATVESVDRFLSSLSGQYARLRKEVNPELVIDQAAELFDRVKARKVIDAVEGYLANGDVRKAMAAFDKARAVEMGSGGWVDPFRDTAAIDKAIESRREPLVVYEDGLGAFFGDALERDALVCLQAPDKVGKSYWLQDIGWMGMVQGRKVAMFQIGDLSQDQIMRRLLTRAAGRPLKATPRHRGPVRFPKSLDMDGDNPVVAHEERRYKRDMDKEAARRAAAKVIGQLSSDECLLRLTVHPNSSISVNGVRTQLDRWARDGWEADIVVIDYSDLLAPVNGTAETRDQINMTWKLLRRMSQELHCLVVTATQSNAGAYGATTQGKANFSEDKRKLAHVTGMVGINQTDPEKRMGVQRLNWIVLREDEFVESQTCVVAGCLAVAMPAVLSHF